jgi:hypothetical protein
MRDGDTSPAPTQAAWPADRPERRALSSLRAFARNARTHSDEQVAQIAASITEWGWTVAVLIDESGEIIAGHARVLAAQRLGLTDIPVIVARGWTDAQKRAYLIADNKLGLNAGWDEGLLKLELSDLRAVGFDLGLTGFADGELQELWFGKPPSTAGSLAERFGIPPFSVFNAREGWWQDRKAAWLRLGIQSELGRGDAKGRTAVAGGSRMPGVDPKTGKIVRTDSRARPITNERGRPANAEPAGGGGGAWKDPTVYQRKAAVEARLGRQLTLKEFRRDHWVPPPADNFSPAGRGARDSVVPAGMVYGEQHISDGADRTLTGTSIFDPVLCELAYRWFCPPGGMVLDPFAGGSVRGVVAGRLGRPYLGVDLSGRQIAANREQAETICRTVAGCPVPAWLEGDSRDIGKLAKGTKADFIFTCPPYADLERYSDDPADISTLGYAEFRPVLAHIIEAVVKLLKRDRFACFVVGDARGPNGAYYGLPWHVIDAFQQAGLKLHNEAVLVTAVGTLPIRAAKQFATSRKLGKTHQNVLVFCKGDAKAATAAIGEAEFGAIPGTAAAADEAEQQLGGEVA